MRKFLLGASAALIALSASAAPRTATTQSERLFQFAPKAKACLKSNALASAQSQSLPTSDAAGYLNGPKGAIWFYTLEYKGETIDHGAYSENVMTGFKLTVYDDKFDLVGTVEDVIELQEGETKIAQFSLGPDVTQKFFNFDNSYEIMMGVAFNTTAYVNKYRTYAYSIGKNDRIAAFDGYYCSAVNSATDAWSEKFWITFMTTEETVTPDVNGVENTSDYRFRTYKAAGHAGMGDPVVDVRFPEITMAGADAIPFIANVFNGKPFFSVNHLKYCWYEDPYDYLNENPTADNELIVDIFAPASSWASTVDKYCTTTFPLNPSAQDLYYLYFGNFSYNDDLNFQVNADGSPVLFITRAHPTRGGDDFTYDYEAYNAAPQGQTADGQLKFSVAQGSTGGTFMADIKGFDPQVMFIDADSDNNMTFRFVNQLTGAVEHEIDANVDPENPNVSLTAETNRIPRNGKYVYYAPQTRGASSDDGHTHTSVIYVDPESGSLVGSDDIDLGTGVEYAQVYSGNDIFDPYIFNLDDAIEHMALVKRRSAQSDALIEELMVVSTDPAKGTLLTAGPDQVKGNLANVFMANLNGDKPKLIVVYQNSDWKISLDSYDLPLVSFEAGTGTVDDPYQISTVGGLKQISAAPDAHYAVVNDIDADGYAISQKNFDFKGSIDGRNHLISNLVLNEYALFPSMSRQDVSDEEKPEARLTNINFLNPVLNASKDAQGILVGNMTCGHVENVHVYGGKVNSSQDVGGLVGNATLYSRILNSSFHGEINAPESSVGGIVMNTKTSATVRACAFKGSIIGAQEVGGIAGSTNSNAGILSDCHVDAVIKGKNTVGGVVGGSARSVIKNCHVEGSLEATEAPTWGGGPKLGGVVGKLERSYGDSGEETGDGESEGDESGAVIQGCYVNLASMTFSGEAGNEEYEGQNDTMHRIVGWSSANDWPEEIGYDPDNYDPIYGDPAPAETALQNNYAVAALPAGNEGVATDHSSTEGASVAADETGISFFQDLGWMYGYDFENPWNMTGNQFYPSLYFEGGIPVLTPADVTVKVNAETAVSLKLVGAEITEEMLEGFTCDLSDESVAGLSNMEFGPEGDILLTVKGLKVGTSNLTCGINGKTAHAVVTVTEGNTTGIENTVAARNVLGFNGREVYAEGCMIHVFSTAGACVMSGNDRLALDQLQGGIYIVTAVDAEGSRSSLKISIR